MINSRHEERHRPGHMHSAPLGKRYVIWSNAEGGWLNPACYDYTSEVMKAGRYGEGESAERVKDSGHNAKGVPNEMRIPVEDVELYVRKKA